MLLNLKNKYPEFVTHVTGKGLLLALHINKKYKVDDYEGLEINPDDLYGNLNNSAIFGYKKALERLNGPVDRREWSMSPQTVNAYFSPTKNEIVFLFDR